MIMLRSLPPARRRPGITLTEILIAILILGVGLASLATLFPLGLLRLREAARSTRSAYLMESAASDIVSRGLLTSTSFNFADQYNLNNGLTPWYMILTGTSKTLTYPFNWNPMTQDQGLYLDDPRDPAAPGAASLSSGGYGLPFAYDPLWRFQTTSPTTGIPGYYIGDTLEARFGAGLGYIQNDPSGDGLPPSAHGLQRITNFNRPFVLNAANQHVPIMPAANAVPGIFVSPEDVVWQEPTNQGYNLGLPLIKGVTPTPVGSAPSAVLPDLSIATDAAGNPTPINDWHYSWIFTGQQNNGSGGSTFDGNIVIFENRPFGIIDTTATAPNPQKGYQNYQVDGETVVEAIFGFSSTIVPAGGPGYGVSADRAVLLRWYASQNDPVVKVGDWIADVTYERNALAVQSRFFGYNGGGSGLPNPFNKLEWDNLPAQRCYWYRVQKIVPATADSVAGLRSMIVYVDRSLQARTVLTATGPMPLNAALICPSVVNVIPQTIFAK